MIRNSRGPSWGADQARAFRFPVTCPYSTFSIAVNDEDENPLSADDPLGRIVQCLTRMHDRTVYDCWFDLEWNMLQRARGRRGSIRLRYSIEWFSTRGRLLGYSECFPPPTFVVPFKTKQAYKDSVFCVEGRYANPGSFNWKLFSSQIKDLCVAAPASSRHFASPHANVLVLLEAVPLDSRLRSRRVVKRAKRFTLSFLFWRWPYVSLAVFVLWQFVISYPTEFVIMLPTLLLLAKMRSYLALPRPHPLDAKLTVTAARAARTFAQPPLALAVDAARTPTRPHCRARRRRRR